MSYTIVWSPLALQNLETIHAYIAIDAPQAAQRVAVELELLGDSLSEMPGRGRLVGAGTRELVAGRYLLRYRVEGRVVVVVRLKHSAQAL